MVVLFHVYNSSDKALHGLCAYILNKAMPTTEDISVNGKEMADYGYLVLLGIILVAGTSPPESGSRKVENGLKEIHILLLASFEIQNVTSVQPWFKDGPKIQPAAELAVEQINQRDDILADYSVNLTVANSACNLLGYTAVGFVPTFFHTGVRYAGIVGPTCSESVEFVSAITGEEGVSVLNFHIANSQALTDRRRYRYSFSTVSSSQAFVGLLIHLMRANKWESVAVLYEGAVPVYLNAYNSLVQELGNVFPSGRVSFSASMSDDILPLSSIINQRLRVVLVLSSTNLARKIVCLIKIHYPQLAFPAYQFVFIGRFSFFHYPTNFFFNNHHYECSMEEIVTGIEGYLLTNPEVAADNSTELVSGETYSEYFQQYKERVNGSTTEWANPTYDGVWSLALALNSSIPRLNEIGMDLVDYTHGHREATDIIKDEVLKLHFQGASGHISFSKDTGFTISSIPLLQVLDGNSVPIGYFDENKEQLMLGGDGEFIPISFPSKVLVVHYVLAGCFVLITIFVFVLIATVHILTLWYNKFSDIRASSYRIGQLTFIGCYMIVMCLLCFTLQKISPAITESTTALCVIQVWCLSLGFTLVLGTMAAKTWRLYRIFIHLWKPGYLLHDWALITVVLVLATVDVVLCSVWTAKFNFSTVSQETDGNEVRVECHSDYYHVWFGALSLYQGLIMATALVLALLTKNIRHESFKTKSVTFLVYFLTITLSLGFPLYLILSTTRVSGVDVEYVVLSLTYLAVVCLCFVFLFFPPILSLLRVKTFHKIPGLKRYSKKLNSNKLYHPSLLMA